MNEQSYDDYLKAKVEQGRQDYQAGNVVPLEQAKTRALQAIKKAMDNVKNAA